MNCRETDRDQWVEKYLRGELSPADQDEFETHILECGVCLATLETYQAVWDDLTKRAHEIQVQAPVRDIGFRWGWAGAVAVLLIALGVGFFWYPRLGTKAVSHAPATVPSQPASAAEQAKQTTETSNQAAKAVSPLAQPQPKKRIDFTPTDSGMSKELAASEQAKTETPAQPLLQGPPAVLTNEPATAQMPPAVAAEQPKLAKNEGMNDEQAKELFRLGTVQPPAYTFSGFAASEGSQAKKTGPAHDRGLGAAVSNPGAGRSGEPGRAHFQNAMVAYVERRYGDAAELLEQAAQIEPQAADTNFYLGVCRLVQGNPAGAVAPLKTVLTTPKSPYTQSAHFYLAKAYIQTGDLEQAGLQLQAAGAMAGRFGPEARSLLARLQAVSQQQKPQPQEAPPNPN